MEYNLQCMGGVRDVHDVSFDDRGGHFAGSSHCVAGDPMIASWVAEHTSVSLLHSICPPRKQDIHKGDCGRLLLLCGAEGYTGAPYLAAQAALRSGAGLIFTGVPRAVYPIVAAKLHAPMVFPLPDQDGKLSVKALDPILPKLETADACLLGPGLGRSEELDVLVCEILRCCKCPLVLDADGINAVSGHIDILREAACPIILTPHEGEFRRLTQQQEQDRISGAEALAKNLHAVVLRKGHKTVITDGKKSYVNQTGNAGMATGGSGDVLAGIITALLGQGAAPLQAAAAAAWLHGAAGDLAAEKLGQYALAPTDIIGQLSRLLP